ncbi:MAG: EF-P beta-lysylation protein EpmB [Gammaproteobacteria bacterium]|nr:EF-P beta-lysylation protein EpmB [Gammaproteobacteria bacterium]
MIHRLARQHTPLWQKIQSQGVTHVGELLELTELSGNSHCAPIMDTLDFPLRASHAYIRRIEKGNPDDPLLRQILPTLDETIIHPDYQTDPLSEQEQMPVPGLLHKYHGRVLLTLTGACAIHCRYCFRRHFPYNKTNPATDNWAEALNYIQTHPEIKEVILSGGDPLSISDRRLQALSQRLDNIPHLQRLRIHSRHPIVLPERINEELLIWLRQSRLQTIMVIHSNHVNEIDQAVKDGLDQLNQAGVTLLNQSVLLKGVNDNSQTLIELSERLLNCKVQPYYLHQLDPVQGAAHFAVSDEHARELIQELHQRLPGYLLPRLVREYAGEPGKTPL